MAATSTQGVGGLLSHYVPSPVLRDARELALQFRREEFVRAYAASHWWLIVPAGMIFMMLSGLCTSALVALALAFIAPTRLWLAQAIVFAAPVLWIGGVILQVNLLFGWLERRALAAMPSARDVRRGSAASFKMRLQMPALVFAALMALIAFVLVMLVPEIALLFLGLGLLIPIVIMLFDR